MIIYWGLPGVYQRGLTFLSITLQPLRADQSTISHMKGEINSFHMMYSIMTSEIPDTGHYRTASAIPWARKQVISGFLAQGSAEAFLS